MKPYIYGRRNNIHVIDIRETLRGLLRAQQFISRVVANGSDVLFVGTKRQAREAIHEQTARSGMHYVTERWLGGILTNFRTIRSRLKRLEELEELIGSPRWDTGYSKKMQSTLSRELRKIRRNLSGIRNMTKLPGALVVVDVRKESNALREAASLGIPTVCLIDTDSDPDRASIPIPGNDDSMRSIQLVVTRLTDAIEEGKRGRPEPAATAEGKDSGDSSLPPRRRGRRGGAAPSPQVGPAVTAAPAAPAPAVPAPVAPAPAAETAPATPAPAPEATPATPAPAPEAPKPETPPAEA